MAYIEDLTAEQVREYSDEVAKFYDQQLARLPTLSKDDKHVMKFLITHALNREMCRKFERVEEAAYALAHPVKSTASKISEWIIPGLLVSAAGGIILFVAFMILRDIFR